MNIKEVQEPEKFPDAKNLMDLPNTLAEKRTVMERLHKYKKNPAERAISYLVLAAKIVGDGGSYIITEAMIDTAKKIAREEI